MNIYKAAGFVVLSLILAMAVVMLCAVGWGSLQSAQAMSDSPYDWKMVYTRQPIPTNSVGPYADAANWMHTTDVGRINKGIIPADVVLDDLDGHTAALHKCTDIEHFNCVAHEARVSPDGKKIAYSVGYSDKRKPVWAGMDMKMFELPELSSAEIFIYDLEAKKYSKLPQPRNAIDRQPEWLDNETLVISSNRGNTYPFRKPTSQHQDPKRCTNPGYCVSQEYGYTAAGKSMQLWVVKIDGSGARNITPHEQMALSPAVMPNGDILYSCWNAHENKNHDTFTSTANLAGTAKNKWWLCRVDGNGADGTVILNGHKPVTLKSRNWLTGVTGGEEWTQLRAIRSVAMIFPGKLAVTNYYRDNHVGSMGIIFGMDYDDPHVEGCSTAACYPDGMSKSSRPGSGQYTPSSIRAITPYGQDQDNVVRLNSKGIPLGKAGYPAPMPNSDTEFVITHARGSCYEGTEPYQTQQAWLKGEPPCRKGIYKVKVPMVTDPFDIAQMELIAGGEGYQAFDGRMIAPYKDFWGKDLPDRPAPLDGDACYLQVVDARGAELFPAYEYDWAKTLYDQCAHQGCAVQAENPSYHAEHMKYLRVLLPEMWDYSYNDHKNLYVDTRNTFGHKSIAILGSQRLESDGSVKMRVPCETPLIMQGTDGNGMAMAHDAMLHSLRKGETRTCQGCHDGHSEERARILAAQGTLQERFAKTVAAKTHPTLALASAPITWRKHIKPIIDARCTTCHEHLKGPHAYSSLIWDYQQLDWPNAPKVKTASNGGGVLMTIPYRSKYAEHFALNSLLYWKCLGSRQDGRTDAQYGNDIDFGRTHISGAAAAECRMIGRWIDTGAQY